MLAELAQLEISLCAHGSDSIGDAAGKICQNQITQREGSASTVVAAPAEALEARRAGNGKLAHGLRVHFIADSDGQGSRFLGGARSHRKKRAEIENLYSRLHRLRLRFPFR